jgi:hypothetical protein
MKNQKEIEALELAISILQKKVDKLKNEDAMRDGRPFPVPPSGCPDGWYDNGGGLCVVNS